MKFRGISPVSKLETEIFRNFSVFKMSTKPFGAKVRVQSGETVKMHIAQCTNMQVNVENTFKKNQGFSIQYTKC